MVDCLNKLEVPKPFSCSKLLLWYKDRVGVLKHLSKQDLLIELLLPLFQVYILFLICVFFFVFCRGNGLENKLG